MFTENTYEEYTDLRHFIYVLHVSMPFFPTRILKMHVKIEFTYL